MSKHAQMSARPLTFTFKIFSKPGGQFQWIKAPSSWRNPPFLSMYNPCPTRPVGSPLHPGFGRRRIRASTRRGSRRIYRHADRRVVVAYHALNHTFPIGTLGAMIADAGWRDDDLLRFGLIE